MRIPFVNYLLKQFRNNASTDPVRDWIILLIFFSIVFITTIVWNMWAFDTVANGGVIGAKAPSTAPVISETSIGAMRDVLKTRSAEESKYTTGVYIYTDPSL